MSTKRQRTFDAAIDWAKEFPKAVKAVQKAAGVDEWQADRAVWAAHRRDPRLRGMDLVIVAIDEATVRKARP